MGGMNSNIGRNEGWFLGEDRTLRFTVLDDANQPVNITGWAILFAFQDKEGGATLFSRTPDMVDANGGVCDVQIDPTDTEDLFPGTYFYILERMDPGNVSVLAYGAIVLMAT